MLSEPVHVVLPNRSPVFAGVAIGSGNIRAGLFTPSLRLLGKTKISTKLERGARHVIERIARCVRYALDDSDLQAGQLAAVGVGVPGSVDAATGLVRVAPGLGWTAVQLQSELEQLLGLPVRIGNGFDLAALAIHQVEFQSIPGTVAVLFVAPRVGLAIVRNGQRLDLTSSTATPLQLEAPEQNIFRTLHHPQVTALRNRELRAALRSGNEAAQRLFAEMISVTAELADRIQTQLNPAAIALTGDAVDEMHADILREVRRKLGPSATILHASALGTKATITGAAAWVRDRELHPVLDPVMDPVLDPPLSSNPNVWETTPNTAGSVATSQGPPHLVAELPLRSREA